MRESSRRHPEPGQVQADTLRVGEFELVVRRSPRRRTLELAVERDGSLSLLAPTSTPEETLLRFVHSRQEWLYRKTAHKERLLHAKPKKEYVSGEGFFYLGRTYRLKLVEQGEEPLRLTNGRFELLRVEAEQGRSLFERWYSDHLKPRLEEQTPAFAQRLGVEVRAIKVQELGYRWGSCGKRELFFHWRVAMLPKPMVEYLLVHEMAHLLVAGHKPEFWRVVERVVPDFEAKRSWLAKHGDEYNL